MSSKSCEPCHFHGSLKNADFWCTNCEEMLCKDCRKHHQSSKATRGHHLCTVQEYEFMESHPFKVPSRCTTHNKKYEAYCITHEQPCCIICVTVSHGGCAGVVAFEDALKGFQSKTALSDLDERLNNFSINVDNFKRSRERVLSDLEQQKERLEHVITEKRRGINEYLDKIEERLRGELKSKYNKCIGDVKIQADRIKQKQGKVEEIKSNFEQVKEKKTGVQLFLATGEIHTMILDQENFVENIYESLHKYDMSVTFDDTANNLLMALPSFGNIHITESPCRISMVLGPSKTPLVDVPWIFKPVQLKQKKKIAVKKGDNGLYINSGVIIGDGRIVLTDKYNNRLIVYTESGVFQRDIPLSCSPWDVTEVEKSHVAVSLPDSSLVEVVDINKGKIVNKFNISGQCSGISFTGANICVAVAGDGIQVLDMKGHKVKTLPVDVTRETFMTGDIDKLYYTHYTTHTVHCTTIDHEQVYKFHHDELNFPQDLSVDGEGHVFVTGFISNTLLCVSPDGQHRQVLLRQSDGLNSPTAVFFDKKRKLLLVCTNSASTVSLYEIVH